MIKLIIQLPL